MNKTAKKQIKSKLAELKALVPTEVKRQSERLIQEVFALADAVRASSIRQVHFDYGFKLKKMKTAERQRLEALKRRLLKPDKPVE